MKTTANVHPVLSFWQVKGSSTAGGPCATVFFDPNKTKVWHCKGCGRLYEASALDSGRVHAEGASAKAWPDFLFGFELIVSERVLAGLKANRMSGFVPHQVSIHKIDSAKLRELAPPKYYLLELIGTVAVDRTWYDDYKGNECPVCHEWTPAPGGKHIWAPMLVPLMNTWDGSDFLQIRSPASGLRLCTTRVVELARHERWSGAQFETITPRQFPVDYRPTDWFKRIERKVRAAYPDLFSAQKEGTHPGSAE